MKEKEREKTFKIERDIILPTDYNIIARATRYM